VLDNTKWNANKLLRGITEKLSAAYRFGAMNDYRKESFSRPAAPELVDRIVEQNGASPGERSPSGRPSG